uniref:Uncharacterized protein n=1 Tax=Ascaris lumbricoides TaxID=6252 RepID=A0A0M3I9M3_ASCLU
MLSIRCIIPLNVVSFFFAGHRFIENYENDHYVSIYLY